MSQKPDKNTRADQKDVLQKLEKAYKDSERKYRELIDLIPLGIFEFGMDGIITYCNPMGLEMMGYTLKDIDKDLSIFNFVISEEAAKVKARLQILFAGQALEGEEYTAVRKNGNTFPVMIHSYPILRQEKVVGIRCVAFDHSKSKKIEQQLLELLTRYEIMLKALPDLIFRFDKDGRFIDYHSNSPQLMALNPEDFMGKVIGDVELPDPLKKRGLEKIHEALKTGEITIDEYTLEGPEGPGYFEARYIPIGKDEVLDIIRDITHRVKTEKALHESEERFQDLYERIPLGMYRTTPDNRILLANPALLNLLGVSSLDEINEIGFSKLTEEIGYNRDAFIQEIEKQGELKGYESQIVLRNGKVVYIRENARKNIDESGHVYYEGSIEDITLQKKAVEALRLTQFSVDQNADAAFWMENDARFFYVNEAACKVLGYSREELLQMTVYDIDPRFPEEIWQDHWKELKERKTFSVESVHRCKDGRELPVELLFNFLEFDGKEYNCAFARDITDRKQNEEKLRKSKERAEEANRFKTEFISNISHEIRTPLNSIIGFSEMLTTHLEDSRLKEYASSIKTAGNSLLMLINDILDLSKIEAGRMEISLEPIDLRSLIKETSQIFAVKVAGKDLDFIVDVHEDVPENLLLDKVRIRQVLFNLIGNAVKYTNNGFIRLIVKVMDGAKAKKGKIGLEIRVEDSGIGISEKYHDKIFSSFFQVAASDNISMEGTGLGLSITKRLVEMMSGTIKVESKSGEGSSFIVRLEGIKAIYGKRQSDEQIELRQTGFFGKHVLLVDDSDINRRFVKDYLEESGVVVSEAVNGEEGLEKALTLMPDIIMLDIMMPVMDGYELIAKIRSHKDLAGIPVMALTALAMKEDIERIQECGFDDFLIKPFHIEELYEKMIRMLGEAGHKGMLSEDNGQSLYQRDEKKYIRSVSAALKQIEKEYLSIWVQANELKEFNAIREFAEGIHKMGIEFDIRFLVDYGDKLIVHCDNYDIEKIDISLSAFPDYLKKMREISQTEI